MFKHRKEIISAFAPVKDHAAKVDQYISNIREMYPNYTLVGVHIRRGDYKTWRNGKFYFDNDTFTRWITELSESSEKKMVFVVFSNEAIKPEDFGGCSAEIVKGPDHPIQDLYVMSQCDYIFGPPSSYSWWAAFYGEKKYLTMYSCNQTINERDFSLVKGEEFNPDRYI